MKLRRWRNRIGNDGSVVATVDVHGLLTVLLHVLTFGGNLLFERDFHSDNVGIDVYGVDWSRLGCFEMGE